MYLIHLRLRKAPLALRNNRKNLENTHTRAVSALAPMLQRQHPDLVVCRFQCQVGAAPGVAPVRSRYATLTVTVRPEPPVILQVILFSNWSML